MADRRVDHLLIGGGVASANCARWLREAGGEGSIMLVGREPEPPYNRPPLTKKYLLRDIEREDAYCRPAAWWGENGIELLTSVSVTKFDADAKTAKLSTSEEVEFGSALLATGANVRRLRVEGGALEGIHYVRAFGNADGIAGELEEFGTRVACVGGSYIGCEVAASLASRGARCTIVMMEDLPCERTLGREIGEWLATELSALGVTIHGGQTLERFVGAGDSSEGRMAQVVTEQGLVVEADLVVVGAGVTPDTMLAKGAGLAIGERGGILCDSHLRTSATDVYAAGDVCEYDSPHHEGTVRVEHWDVAFNHGKTVALNMLGQPTAHETVPYFWTEIGDFEIESVGPAYEWDDVEIRGSMPKRDFSAWFHKDGRVVQVAAVNRPDDIEAGRRRISGLD